jgi:hypothetical protein
MAMLLNLNWLRLNVCLMELRAGRNYLPTEQPRRVLLSGASINGCESGRLRVCLVPLPHQGRRQPSASLADAPFAARRQAGMIHQRVVNRQGNTQ